MTDSGNFSDQVVVVTGAAGALCQAVVDAGATTVNIPDTVGWAVPAEFGSLIGHLHAEVPEPFLS